MQNIPYLPDPQRVRKVPKHFSWVDHRLVRNGYVNRCSSSSLGLYLILVTVSDRSGLSWYRDETLAQMCGCSTSGICGLRRELTATGLVAYSRPFYQVLSLDEKSDNTAEIKVQEVRASGADSPASDEEVSKILAKIKRRLDV